LKELQGTFRNMPESISTETKQLLGSWILVSQDFDYSVYGGLTAATITTNTEVFQHYNIV
jgi:hypothetical protein